MMVKKILNQNNLKNPRVWRRTRWIWSNVDSICSILNRIVWYKIQHLSTNVAQLVYHLYQIILKYLREQYPNPCKGYFLSISVPLVPNVMIVKRMLRLWELNLFIDYLFYFRRFRLNLLRVSLACIWYFVPKTIKPKIWQKYIFGSYIHICIRHRVRFTQISIGLVPGPNKLTMLNFSPTCNIFTKIHEQTNGHA